MQKRAGPSAYGQSPVCQPAKELHVPQHCHSEPLAPPPAVTLRVSAAAGSRCSLPSLHSNPVVWKHMQGRSAVSAAVCTPCSLIRPQCTPTTWTTRSGPGLSETAPSLFPTGTHVPTTAPWCTPWCVEWKELHSVACNARWGASRACGNRCSMMCALLRADLTSGLASAASGGAATLQCCCPVVAGVPRLGRDLPVVPHDAPLLPALQAWTTFSCCIVILVSA